MTTTNTHTRIRTRIAMVPRFVASAEISWPNPDGTGSRIANVSCTHDDGHTTEAAAEKCARALATEWKRGMAEAQEPRIEGHFTYAYRNGDVYLHKYACNDLTRRDQWGQTYTGKVSVRGTLDEAIDAAALDWLEAVDYGDGEWRDDISGGVKEYAGMVEAMPCAKDTTGMMIVS